MVIEMNQRPKNRRGALNEGQTSRRKPGSVVETDIRYEPRTVENRHHVSQYDIPRYGHENVVGNETYPPLEARTERYRRDDRRRGTIGQSEVPITSTRNSKYRERETDYSRPKYYDRDRIETTERCEERNVNTGNVKRRAPVSRKQIPDLKSEEFIPMDSRMNEHRTYSIDEYSDYEEEMRNEIDRKMMQEQLDRLQQQKRRALSIQAREEAIRQKELQLDRKEKELKHRQALESKQKADAYDEALASKERELEDRVLNIKKRENSIVETEAVIDENQSVREKELSAAKSLGTDEQETDHMSKISEARQKEILTSAEIGCERKENIASGTNILISTGKCSEQSGLKRVDRGTDAYAQDKAPFFPKFSTFSGNEQRQGKECTFEVWKFEVQSCLDDNVHTHQAIAQAIRKSLTGQAKQVLMSCGTTASIHEIMKRLERVFGNVASGESMMQEFYTASQKQNEDVVTWGLRLQGIVDKAVDIGYLKKENTNTMLKDRFWKGLRSEKLKNRSQIHFINISDYQELLSQVKKEENDLKFNPGVQQQIVKTQIGFSGNSEPPESVNLETVYEKLTVMEENMKELNKKIEEKPKPRPFDIHKRNKDGNTEDETKKKELNY